MKPVSSIKKSADFARLRENSVRAHADGFFVSWNKADTPVRLGIVITTKVGKANVRNRLRRQIKAASGPVFSGSAGDWSVVCRPDLPALIEERGFAWFENELSAVQKKLLAKK